MPAPRGLQLGGKLHTCAGTVLCWPTTNALAHIHIPRTPLLRPVTPRHWSSGHVRWSAAWRCRFVIDHDRESSIRDACWDAHRGRRCTGSINIFVAQVAHSRCEVRQWSHQRHQKCHTTRRCGFQCRVCVQCRHGIRMSAPAADGRATVTAVTMRMHTHRELMCASTPALQKSRRVQTQTQNLFRLIVHAHTTSMHTHALVRQHRVRMP